MHEAYGKIKSPGYTSNRPVKTFGDDEVSSAPLSVVVSGGAPLSVVVSGVAPLSVVVSGGASVRSGTEYVCFQSPPGQ
jgi:hypothetical protein